MFGKRGGQVRRHGSERVSERECGFISGREKKRGEKGGGLVRKRMGGLGARGGENSLILLPGWKRKTKAQKGVLKFKFVKGRLTPGV